MEARSVGGHAAPSRARAWIHSLRAPTLAAAVVPVLVGSAVATREGFFRSGPALAALFGALCIQVGTNFANDLYDFRKGADRAGRIGPPRALASGWLAPGEVRRAMVAAFALATLAGVYLALQAGWAVVVIGILSIAAGVGYTAGRWALGYHGLGDLAVFVFFGIVAVTGTYFVQARAVSPLAMAAALPVGALCTNILVVNNVRDRNQDRASGKRTMAVLLGSGAARAEYALMLAIAYAVPLFLWRGGELRLAGLLPWLSLPLAIHLLRVMLARDDGPSLNVALVRTARLHVVFGSLFAAGILL